MAGFELTGRCGEAEVVRPVGRPVLVARLQQQHIGRVGLKPVERVRLKRVHSVSTLDRGGDRQILPLRRHRLVHLVDK